MIKKCISGNYLFGHLRQQLYEKTKIRRFKFSLLYCILLLARFKLNLSIQTIPISHNESKLQYILCYRVHCNGVVLKI